MTTGINWDILRPVDIGGAVQQGFASGQRAGQMRARQSLLAQYGANPTGGVPAALWAVDENAAATLSQNDRQRVVADRQTQDALRTSKAREMVPDVLSGLSLGGARTTPAAAQSQPNGDIVVAAPTPHKTVADVYALDPEIAGGLVTKIGEMQDHDRKRLGFEADTLGAAAFAARQVPYAKRRDVIDSFRRQLTEAGISQSEIDDFDPTDETLASAITHSLGVKNALSAAIDERKFAWQQQDDRIDNARDDHRVGIQSFSARDASARGWSADRRSEKRFQRGDSADLGETSNEALLQMLRNN
jgi:hypothetical protein